MAINEQRQGVFFAARLGNMLIRALRPWMKPEVRIVEPDQPARFWVSDNNVILDIPRGAGGAGGGLPEGFDEEELDIVESDNTPGTRIFLTKEP